MNANCDSIYKKIKSTAALLSEINDFELELTVIELSADYDLFLKDYQGPRLVDGYCGFVEMLRTWRVPWPECPNSVLGGLTLAQFFLAWA